MNQQNILIIDDDKATQGWLSAVLNKAGYITATASSGQQALEVVSVAKPHLIIMELILPDVDGVALYDELRRLPNSKDVPIIILSRKDDPDDIAAALDMGADDYIIKRPGADRELLGKCTSILGKSRPISKPLPVGKLITFFSAKGGMGTSTLCVNLAHMLSRQIEPKTVLVADLVLPIGSLGTMVGASEKESLAKLTNEPSSLDFTLLKQYIEPIETWNFSILRGSPSPAEAQELQVKRIDPLFSTLVLMYDYLFVDVGRNLSRISLPILQRSNLIIIVLGPDLVTVEHTQTAIEYLLFEKIPSEKLFLVMNRAVGREGLTKAEIEKKLNLPIQSTIPYAQDNFTLATNQKQPYAARFSDGTTMVLNELARQVRRQIGVISGKTA